MARRRTSQAAADRWAKHAAAVKTHVAEYERGVHTISLLRAKLARAETVNAEPLVALAKVVGRAQAAALVGVDVRVVNRAYKTVRNGKGAETGK